MYTPYYNSFPQLHLRTFLYLNPLRILVFWRKIKKIKCRSLTCECKYCSLSMDLWSFLIQVCVIIDCDRSLHLDQYHETVNADLFLIIRYSKHYLWNLNYIRMIIYTLTSYYWIYWSHLRYVTLLQLLWEIFGPPWCKLFSISHDLYKRIIH